MVNDEFYYGQLSQLVLSSSSLKLLLSSPKTYKYVTKYGSAETQPLRDGRLIHMSILEPDKFQEQIFVNVSSKNSKSYKEAKKKYGLVYTRVILKMNYLGLVAITHHSRNHHLPSFLTSLACCTRFRLKVVSFS